MITEFPVGFFIRLQILLVPTLANERTISKRYEVGHEPKKIETKFHWTTFLTYFFFILAKCHFVHMEQQHECTFYQMGKNILIITFRL